MSTGAVTSRLNRTAPRRHKQNLNARPGLCPCYIKRRSEVVGIFPNEAAVVRLVGALLLEQSDEWAVQRARYMTLETIAPLSHDLGVSLPLIAA
jgi:transposase-like protein